MVWGLPLTCWMVHECKLTRLRVGGGRAAPPSFLSAPAHPLDKHFWGWVGVRVPSNHNPKNTERGDVDFDDDRANDSDRERRWEGSQASGADEFVESTDEFEVAEVRSSVEIQRALRGTRQICKTSSPIADVWGRTSHDFSTSQADQVRSARGWKLLMLLPGLLLFRPPVGGNISTQKLSQRFQDFARAQWAQLLDARRFLRQIVIVRDGVTATGRTQDVEKRAAKVSMVVQLGEFSSAREALEGADLAPSTRATLAALRDPARRPEGSRDPIPERWWTCFPVIFELDGARFAKSLRSWKRGVAGGPSSRTIEHLRPVLDSSRDIHLLFHVCQSWATDKVHQEVRTWGWTVWRLFWTMTTVSEGSRQETSSVSWPLAPFNLLQW